MQKSKKEEKMEDLLTQKEVEEILEEEVEEKGKFKLLGYLTLWRGRKGRGNTRKISRQRGTFFLIYLNNLIKNLGNFSSEWLDTEVSRKCEGNGSEEFERR